MSAVLAAALLAKAVFVLLLLLSCVLGQEDGVCFGRERDLALGCVRRKEVSTRAKQVAAEQQARREAWRPCKQLAGRRRRKLEPRPSFTPPLLAAGPPSPPPALTPLPSSSPSSPKLPPLC